MEVRLYKTSYIWRPSGPMYALTYSYGRFNVTICLTTFSNKTGIVVTLKLGASIFEKVRLITFSHDRQKIVASVKKFIIASFL